MIRLIVCFLVLFILAPLAVPQELAAQDMLNRMLRTGKYKRYLCGDMAAYNRKVKPYHTKKKIRLKKSSDKLAPRPTSSSVAARTKTQSKPAAKSSPKVNKRNNSDQNTVQEASLSKTPVNHEASLSKIPINTVASVVPNVSPSPKPATLAPVQPKPPVADKAPSVIDRDKLKEMTVEKRRDTLRQMEPEIVLPPIRFVHNQDEFSVVNMDSFMQAMEYAQQGKVVFIEGHTDDLGSDDYNVKLSMKRAEKIRQLLISGGVSDELISVIGFGESQPIVPNTNNENRAINRRIEFKIFNVQK